MKSAALPPLVALALALGSASSEGQAFSQASATAGSVAAQGAGGWTGLSGSASRATIGYGVGGQSIAPPNPLKFATTADGVQGKDLPGFSAPLPGGFASSQGASTVTNANGDAPAYYNAGWTSNQFSDGTGAGGTDSGTFDPYDVRRSDVSGLVGANGGPLSLYFQSALGKGGNGGGTFLRGTARTVASYSYSLFFTDANEAATGILTLGFSSATGLSIAFNPNSGVDLFLLSAANATDPAASPDARIARGTLVTAPKASDILVPLFNPDGSLSADIAFGVRRRLNYAPGGLPTDRLVTWHTDTSNRTTPVPEPATLAALTLGTTALLRRRRRA